MIAVEKDGQSVCDRCESGPVQIVQCERWEREFLCKKCAGIGPDNDGQKVTFSYQTDNTGTRHGKNWSKGGRR